MQLDALTLPDAELVARVEIATLRERGLIEPALVALRFAGMSSAVLEAIAPCMMSASTLHLGVRLGSDGFEGDTVVRVVMGEVRGEGLPCCAQGWRSTGAAAGLETFEPRVAEHERSVPALVLRDARGQLLLTTPGPIDGLLRELREGPEPTRLQAPLEGAAGLALRVEEKRLPRAWRDGAPTIAAMTRGLRELTLQVDATARVMVRAKLVYGSVEAASKAVGTLKALRAAMAVSERRELQEAAKGAHAERRGAEIVVDVLVGEGESAVQ